MEIIDFTEDNFNRFIFEIICGNYGNIDNIILTNSETENSITMEVMELLTWHYTNIPTGKSPFGRFIGFNAVKNISEQYLNTNNLEKIIVKINCENVYINIKYDIQSSTPINCEIFNTYNTIATV